LSLVWEGRVGTIRSKRMAPAMRLFILDTGVFKNESAMLIMVKGKEPNDLDLLESDA
jgi:hypothetical protein